MSSDDEALDILTPSVTMLPVLTGLRASLSRLGDTKTKSAPRVWDNIDFEGTASAMARFALCEDGWVNGDIPPDDIAAANDIRHYLSVDLEIMSPDDLFEQFRAIVDGAPLTREYRRIFNAPDVSRLLKDHMALGWGGFDVVQGNTVEQELIRRRRMFVDYFRHDFGWARLRAMELSRAAALLEKALYVEMVAPSDIFSRRQRVVGEALARFASWNAFARAALCARAFESIEEGVTCARQRITQDEAILQGLLEGPWKAINWPRVAP